MNSSAKGSFECQACGWATGKWVGRCGGCQEWGTVSEVAPPPPGVRLGPPVGGFEPALPVGEVPSAVADRRPTGVAEFDRVLGGGLVPGAVLLLAGEPGVGKSTLLLDVLAKLARTGQKSLYVTGEESIAQVRNRAERIGALAPGLYLAGQAQVAAVAKQVAQVRPDVLVIDSIATMVGDPAAGLPGGMAQLRAASAGLIQLAKEGGLATILVGHVTKDGAIAGPRAMEHLVDVVLSFEGDRHDRLRLLRSVKNRYGPTDEVGCFELGESGIRELPDPSGLFLVERQVPTAGTCVTAALEGRRPLLSEIQALVVPAASAPRRVTSGLDASRVALILAVLERQVQLPLSRYETYLATVGGARLREPATDLAAALAVFGSVRDLAMPLGWVAFGEVGLAGDLRAGPGARARVAEAARLGVTDVLLPRGEAKAVGKVSGVTLHPAGNLGEALTRVPFVPGRPQPEFEAAGGPRALRLVAPG